MNLEPLSDQELVEMIRNPDTRHYGLNLLVRQYQRVLYRIIARMVVVREDAEDVLQEAFIRISEKIGSLKDPANLGCWMMKVATNEALMFLRKKKVRSLFILPLMNRHTAYSLDQYPALTGDEIQMKFHKALLTLADRQRAIFNLKYFEEMKYRQIAAILDITEGACKAAYRKAVVKIENYMTEH